MKALGKFLVAGVGLTALLAFGTELILSGIYESRFLGPSYEKADAQAGRDISREIKDKTIYVDPKEAGILNWMNVYLPTVMFSGFGVCVIAGLVERYRDAEKAEDK